MTRAARIKALHGSSSDSVIRVNPSDPWSEILKDWAGGAKQQQIHRLPSRQSILFRRTSVPVSASQWFKTSASQIKPLRRSNLCLVLRSFSEGWTVQNPHHPRTTTQPLHHHKQPSAPSSSPVPQNNGKPPSSTANNRQLILCPLRPGSQTTPCLCLCFPLFSAHDDHTSR